MTQSLRPRRQGELAPMRATRLLSSAAAVLLALCVSHPAQATPLHLDLGVFGWWHYIASTNQLGIDVGNTNPDLKLKQSGTFGLRVGFIVHPYVSLEAELALTPTSASIAAGDAQAILISYRAALL